MTQRLVLGRTYSRPEIAKILGCRVQDALPAREGRVLCGCFRPTRDFNPGAPAEITIGPSKTNRALEAAKLLARQDGTIPVFLCEGRKAWKYVGRYEAVGFRADTKLLDEKMRENPDRGPIVAVLYLRRARSVRTKKTGRHGPSEATRSRSVSSARNDSSPPRSNRA